MYGAAADFAAMFEDGFVNVMSPHTLSTETWQQGWVYVHNAACVSVRYLPEAEPTGLYDEVNVCGGECIFDFFAEFIDVRAILFSNDFDF